ncbi:MAG: aminotransferase class IV [Pirellula sp.]|jgi:branched-subunit amino acid aminotransferase/4-amino-4-deoxychorismate lyase|nr:aminotransferase class IV [Pirellula sp.]
MNLPTATHLAGSVAFRIDNTLKLPVACDAEQLGWNVYDPGPANGAILVERIRTFGARVVDLEINTQRLILGAKTFFLPSDSIANSFRIMASAIVEENNNLIKSLGDVSVVIVYSPTEDGGWQSIAHLAPIPFQKLKGWYKNGTSLLSTEIKVPTTEFMPNYIKHRSRLHYWLADRAVQSNSPGGVALLETTDGFIADTSIANIVIVTKQGQWITPTTRNAIHGTTLRRVCRLLQKNGTEVDSAKLKKEDIFRASEVLLLGTTGCIWNATQLDNVRIGADPNTPKTKWLQSLWADWVGVDVVQQAMTHPTKPQ